MRLMRFFSTPPHGREGLLSSLILGKQLIQRYQKRLGATQLTLIAFCMPEELHGDDCPVPCAAAR